MFGNKKNTNKTPERSARDVLGEFRYIPGFHVGYYISLSMADEIADNVEDLKKLLDRLKPVADEYKKSAKAPKHIWRSHIFDTLPIPHKWNKEILRKEIEDIIKDYTESDYLENIKERGLKCRDIVEVPHVFTPFENKDKDTLHRIPKRIVSAISLKGEVAESSKIMRVCPINLEHMNLYEFYGITAEERELLADIEKNKCVMVVEGTLESWENADIDLRKTYISMNTIEITTINAQTFTVKCIPELTTIVIDRLNEAFGFYE